MSTQYDNIAENYKNSKRLPIFKVIEHTLVRCIGDVKGKSLLDLACGDGFNTRSLKQLGAGHTVGVDISAEMVRLARAEEIRAPLGIEYVCSAVQQLGTIGSFDLVTAVFLLNYAKSRADLATLCRTIYEAVKPGQRFAAIVDDGAVVSTTPGLYRKYGFNYRIPDAVREGDPVTIEVQADEESWFTFESHVYFRETYESTLRSAGFSAVTWQPLVVPPELEGHGGREYWALLLEHSPILLVDCRR